MRESIRFDTLGQIHVDFDDEYLIHVFRNTGIWIRPRLFAGRNLLINQPLAYERINWIGLARKRQLSLAIVGIPCCLMCLLWMIANWGDWGPFAISVVFGLVLGVLPLAFFVRGRAYLGIASQAEIIALPMDRSRKQIRRVLGLLALHCPGPTVQWSLEGSPFVDRSRWNNQVKVHRPFNLFRYQMIMVAISSIASFKFLDSRKKTEHLAKPVSLSLLAIGVSQALAIRRRRNN